MLTTFQYLKTTINFKDTNLLFYPVRKGSILLNLTKLNQSPFCHGRSFHLFNHYAKIKAIPKFRTRYDTFFQFSTQKKWASITGVVATSLAGLKIGLSLSEEEEREEKIKKAKIAINEQNEYDPVEDNKGMKKRTCFELLRNSYFKVFIWLDQWLLEPFKVTLRFLYLSYNFLPVVVTFPIWYFFNSVKDEDQISSLDHSVLEKYIWWYKLLKSRLESAGPTFIKLGQWAASRTDIFPKLMCNILAQLQASAKPHSFQETRKAIREAYGCEIEDLFLEFEENPVGVGAIAQVHRAKVSPHHIPNVIHDSFDTELSREERALNRANPEYVAVKVLHPRVHKIIRRDLLIMDNVAYFLNWIPGIKWLSLRDEIYTFGIMMQQQLDLRHEAENLLIFRKNFQNRDNVKFPRPLVDWVSKTVLVELFEFGIPLGYFLKPNQHSPFDSNLSAIGLDAFLAMLIYDNFIHADLHAGNILVRFFKPTAASLVDKAHNLFTEFKLDSSNNNNNDNNETSDSNNITQMLLKHRASPKAFEEAVQKLYAEGYYPQLVFLDAGLVTTLESKHRVDFLELFHAVAEFDGYRAGQLMVERCRSPNEVIDGDIFALKMQHLVLNVKKQTFQLGKIDVASILGQVMSMVRQHQVKLEGAFVNVVISILILEGIGRTLNPDLDLFKVALPILRNLGTHPNLLKQDEELKELKEEHGTAWWLKVWFQLEAREVLTGMLAGDEINRDFFGPFKPMYLDL